MILVTGATGFIGPKVVHALRAENRPVRCLVRNPRHAATLRAWDCEIAQGDVTDAASLRRAAAGCDAVVHLVSIITGRPQDFERVMSRATRDLVAAAEETGVRRFVLMSALGVSEASRELVPYYRAKWEMEQAVRASRLEHVIFRPSFVFGRDDGVLPMFIRQVRWSPVIPVVGAGDRKLQPIWVDDVAAHFAKGVDLEAAANRTFDLGGPDVVTWNDLYDRIKRVLGKRRLSVHLPVGLVGAGAALAEALPRPPITRDQLKMLVAGDNVCEMRPTLETFGIGLTPLDEQIRRSA
jgi:uncharacterized protein YbjT (DUF2867 family)